MTDINLFSALMCNLSRKDLRSPTDIFKVVKGFQKINPWISCFVRKITTAFLFQVVPFNLKNNTSLEI